MNVRMAGDFRRHLRACVILIALICLSPTSYLKASVPPITEDQVAEHEFAIAKPELVHMNHVLDVEMKRLTLEAGGAPSPEAEKYLKVFPTKHIGRSLRANLDLISYLDTHPAHARYVNNELVFDDPAESKEFHELAVGARIESMSLRK